MKIDRNLLQKIAGAPVPHSQDQVIAHLQTAATPTAKFAAAGLTPLDLAHMHGTLLALDEAGFTTKEAAEYLQVSEHDIAAVLRAVAG